MDIEFIQGDARKLPIPDESVQCIVTSPPYWGLRKYSGEQEVIWDDVDGCAHEWGESISVNATNHTGTARWNHTRNGRDEEQPIEKRVAWLRTQVIQGKFCKTCGAWAGAYGLEPTIEMYVQHTVEVLREMWRVLRKDGVLFLNLGDSYAANRGNTAAKPGVDNKNGVVTPPIVKRVFSGKQPNRSQNGAHACGTDGREFLGCKESGCACSCHDDERQSASLIRNAGNDRPKDLCLIPQRVAIAAQQDGWWVRSMIVWAKPNPMPESCKDRPTDAYEHIIMLTKARRYFWDFDAVQEPCSQSTHLRINQDLAAQIGSARIPGKTNGNMKAVVRINPKAKACGHNSRIYQDRDPSHPTERKNKQNPSFTEGITGPAPLTRNMRNVWEFTTQGYAEAHFATFPEELPRRCILAATRPGDTVLDPFAGTGTTGKVAIELNRKVILNDLAYGDLARKRTRNVQRKLIVGGGDAVV